MFLLYRVATRFDEKIYPLGSVLTLALDDCSTAVARLPAYNWRVTDGIDDDEPRSCSRTYCAFD